MSSKRYSNVAWSEAEEKILEELWFNRKLSPDDINQILDRSTYSILKKAKNLGFPTRTQLTAQWRLEEIKKRLKEVVDG